MRRVDNTLPAGVPTSNTSRLHGARPNQLQQPTYSYLFTEFLLEGFTRYYGPLVGVFYRTWLCNMDDSEGIRPEVAEMWLWDENDSNKQDRTRGERS